MERKNFFYVENVNWAFKEPNNYFISNVFCKLDGLLIELGFGYLSS